MTEQSRPVGETWIEEGSFAPMVQTEDGPVLLEPTAGTFIPKSSYALVISDTGEVKVIVPELDKDSQLTNGHTLMIGLSLLLRQPGWAEKFIADTNQNLITLRDQLLAEEAAPAEA